MRRKFIEAEGEAPKECAEAIALIGELYAIEKRANTGPPEERARLRSEESRAIIKRIEQWALSVRALPGSGLRGAIEYMGGMWENGLLRFLDDPNVPIDNNGTERPLHRFTGDLHPRASRTSLTRAKSARSHLALLL